MALVTEVVAASHRKILAKNPVDQVFETYPAFAAIKAAGKVISGSGRVASVPLLYTKPTNGGGYTEMQVFDIVKEELHTTADENWKEYFEICVYTGLDETKNGGSREKIFSLVDAKMDAMYLKFGERMEIDIFNDGSDNKRIRGLRYIASTTNSPGGISQSSNAWWQAKVVSTAYTYASLTATGVGSNTALYVMESLANSCTGGSTGGPTPKLFLGSGTGERVVVMAMNNLRRYVNDEPLFGIDTLRGVKLAFANAWLIKSNKCPAAYMFFLNPDFLYIVESETKNRVWEDFVKPSNQDVYVGKLLHHWALVPSGCRRQGVLSSFAAT